MASANLVITHTGANSPKRLGLTSQIGNAEQACDEGSVGDPVAANTEYAATLAQANAAAEALLDCDEPESELADYGTQSVDHNTGTYYQFNSGNPVTAGLIKVSYVQGAIDHHATGAAPTPRWLIARDLYVKHSVAQTQSPFPFYSRGPSYSGGYASQALAEADMLNAAVYWIVQVDGGALSIAFNDGFLSDNAAGTPNSTYQAQLVAGPAVVRVTDTSFKLIGGEVGRTYDIEFRYYRHAVTNDVFVDVITEAGQVSPLSASHEFSRSTPAAGSGNNINLFSNPVITGSS